jgi:hypothetical protein
LRSAVEDDRVVDVQTKGRGSRGDAVGLARQVPRPADESGLKIRGRSPPRRNKRSRRWRRTSAAHNKWRAPCPRSCWLPMGSWRWAPTHRARRRRRSRARSNRRPHRNRPGVRRCRSRSSAAPTTCAARTQSTSASGILGASATSLSLYDASASGPLRSNAGQEHPSGSQSTGVNVWLDGNRHGRYAND